MKASFVLFLRIEKLVNEHIRAHASSFFIIFFGWEEGGRKNKDVYL